MDDLERMVELLEMGVHGVVSNDPRLFAQAEKIAIGRATAGGPEGEAEEARRSRPRRRQRKAAKQDKKAGQEGGEGRETRTTRCDGSPGVCDVPRLSK